MIGDVAAPRESVTRFAQYLSKVSEAARHSRVGVVDLHESNGDASAG